MDLPLFEAIIMVFCIYFKYLNSAILPRNSAYLKIAEHVFWRGLPLSDKE